MRQRLALLLVSVTLLLLSTGPEMESYATEPNLLPLTTDSLRGVWSGVATGRGGRTWVFRLQVSTDGAAELDAGFGVGTLPVVVAYAFRGRSLQVVAGRVRAKLEAATPDEPWSSATLDLEGKARLEVGWVAGSIALTSRDERLLDTIGIGLVRNDNQDYLNDVQNHLRELLPKMMDGRNR